MGLSRTVLPAIESVAVEHENIVQVNSNSIRSEKDEKSYDSIFSRYSNSI